VTTEQLGAESVQSGSVSTDEIDINTESLPSYVNESGVPLGIGVSSGPSNYALALQLNDRDAPQGEPGYSTSLAFFNDATSSGVAEEIANISADNQNELSVYTRNKPLDGTDPSAYEKRFNINAGFPQTTIEILSPTGSSQNLVFKDSDEIKWRLWSRDNGNLYLLNRNGEQVVEIFQDDNYVNWKSNRLFGLREISNPSTGDLLDQEWAWDSTNGRWLYRDSNGTVHYFTADGTL
jgi:hypothetical protein